MSWKPEAYPSVSPYLVAEDAEALLGFVAKVFGAEVTRRYDNDDGTIMHVETRIDDTIVMIGQSGGEWKPVTGWVHVYVENARATFERAIENGATEMFAPAHKDGDPDLRAGFTDRWGNCWFAATQVG